VEIEASLAGTEDAYSADWIADAQRWQERGLYRTVADFVAPRPGHFVVDIGTGTGLQLMWLMGLEPDGLYLGTDRTPANVQRAAAFLDTEGLPAAAMKLRSLQQHDDGRVGWEHQRLAELRVTLPVLLRHMRERVVIIDDDIRDPQALQVILGETKIDAAILSLPGGSPARAYEWPYALRLVSAAEERQRIVEVTNDTRMAFFRWAAATVRDGGKVVLAERLSAVPGVPPELAALELVSRFMGETAPCWRPGRVATLPIDGEHHQVQLRASHAGNTLSVADLEASGRTMMLAIVELFRTSQPAPAQRKT
jgi:hypothetical protein